MKKLLSVVFILVFLMNLAIIPAHALENNTLGIHVHQEGNIQITTITGEENIRRYQEAMGEEYEPNLVAIQQRIQISSTINSTTSSGGLSPTFIIPEHEIRNKVVSSYTDFQMSLDISEDQLD